MKANFLCQTSANICLLPTSQDFVWAFSDIMRCGFIPGPSPAKNNPLEIPFVCLFDLSLLATIVAYTCLPRQLIIPSYPSCLPEMLLTTMID